MLKPALAEVDGDIVAIGLREPRPYIMLQTRGDLARQLQIEFTLHGRIHLNLLSTVL